MASEVGVANIALSHMGQKHISSLDESNESARVLNARFDDVRDSVLRAAPWNFAEARASLPKLAAAPAWGYDNQYQLPTDCLFAREIEDGEELNLVWKVEGRKILTDEGAPLNILYTARIEDPNEWDVLFIAALGARLAFETAEQITKSAGLKKVLWDTYIRVYVEATGIDGQEGTPAQSPNDPFLDVMR